MATRGQQQGVAIRFGPRHGARRDGAARTGLGFDDDRLRQTFADLPANQAGNRVGIAPCGKTLVDLDGTIRVGLTPGR